MRRYPQNGEKLYGRGQELLDRRSVSEALDCFQQAERSGFDRNQCAASRWHCWMLLGQFERAWAESDLIAASGAEDPHRFWNGQSWQGKRVMLRCLHGLGDTIQFIRYAPLLRENCRELMVQTHPQLTSLLEGVSGIDRVTTWGPGHVEQEFDWDLQMEVNELPRIFKATVDTLPAAVPYIGVPRHTIDWAGRLFPPRRGLRIGLCWRSGPWDARRSIAIEQFCTLYARSNHQFFSLQKDTEAPALHPLEKYAADVRDTAALILNLDLVITVDTMTAHLAGALGIPVWILLPLQADWRWMLDRSDTPWYPTARLFRQLRPGDWNSALMQVAGALATYESASGDCASLPPPKHICSIPPPAGNPSFPDPPGELGPSRNR
jgi:hypothetical protein